MNDVVSALVCLALVAGGLLGVIRCAREQEEERLQERQQKAEAEKERCLRWKSQVNYACIKPVGNRCDEYAPVEVVACAEYKAEK